MNTRITHIDALEVLDSRGHPTVRARVVLDDGSQGEAAVPSGASTGAFEAHELRDGDPARYRGKGVLKAVANILGPLAQAVTGLDAREQAALDEALIAADGSPNKSRLGANALLAVSLANAIAAAQSAGQPLYRHITHLAQAQGNQPTPRIPLPMINLFSGGKHAGAQVDFQDFLVVPIGAQSFAQAMEMTHAVYYAALDLLVSEHAYQPLVADEGGLAPKLASNEAMLQTSVRAIEKAGLRPGEDMVIAMDVASSHFYDGKRYALAVEGKALLAEEMIDRLEDWCNRYPVVSLEDGLAEEDWANWTLLTQKLGERCQILGDDFFVTNPGRIQRGIAEGAANSVLVKVNQIGTLSEALTAMRLAHEAGWTTVVSARSGETEDDWLADLAIGSGGGQIKVGSITRSERLAKWNRLLAVSHDDPTLPFAGDELRRFMK